MRWAHDSYAKITLYTALHNVLTCRNHQGYSYAYLDYDLSPSYRQAVMRQVRALPELVSLWLAFTTSVEQARLYH